MKRKDDDLRALFERMDRQIPIDQERKARTLTRLSEIMEQNTLPIPRHGFPSSKASCAIWKGRSGFWDFWQIWDLRV